MGIRGTPDEIRDFLASQVAPASSHTPTVTGKGRYELFIPGWRPVSVNRLIGFHFGKIKKLKDKDKVALAASFLVSGIPRAKGRRRVGMTLFFPGKSKRGDSDNYNKSARDAMVACGMIVDDSDKWAVFTEPVLAEGKKATLISLEDLDS
jgi:Holliday junction resolvase RusA-like endonuclease